MLLPCLSLRSIACRLPPPLFLDIRGGSWIFEEVVELCLRITFVLQIEL
jgi:hypothetical protein